MKETLTEAPRSFNSGYSDHYLLYDALTSEFDDANAAATSREVLLVSVAALVKQLEVRYAALLTDGRARAEFDAMVAEIRRVVTA